MTSQENRNAMCPESTIESANRRNFIRKAALATAAVGIGTAVAGDRILPRVSARSDRPACTCCSDNEFRIDGSLNVNNGCPSTRTPATVELEVCQYKICSHASGISSYIICTDIVKCFPTVCQPTAVAGFTWGWIGVSGWSHSGTGTAGTTECLKPSPPGKVGVFGAANTGYGVFGHSESGYGVNGTSSSSAGVFGCSAAASGSGAGVFGVSHSPCGIGVFGGGAGRGVIGAVECGCYDTIPSGTGVGGASDTGCGVFGRSSCGRGVFGHSCNGIGVFGHAVNGGCGVLGESGSGPGVKGTSSKAPGVWGVASTGHGVCGTATAAGGVGVRGVACNPCATPIVARGGSCQLADLQHWQIACTIMSVVNSCGWLGVGTSTPTTPLDVVGAATVNGSLSALACSRTAIPIIAKGACGQTANLQQWEANCGTVYAVINKAGSLGLGGVTNPHHVLCISGKAHASSGFSIGPCTCINTTLAVNGSMAAKTRTVGSTTTLLTTDYAILASGTITLTLPPAKTQNGMMIFIKNTSTSTVSVVPGGTDSIEGSSTARTLTKQYDSLQLISNGSNEWYVLSGAKCGAFVS